MKQIPNDITKQQSQPVKPGFEQVTMCTCPFCGGNMSSIFGFNPPVNVCSDCGCSIEISHQNLDTNPICPSCHQFLGNDNTCPRCGYALGSDFL